MTHFLEFMAFIINHLNNDELKEAYFAMDNMGFYGNQKIMIFIQAHSFTIYL